MFFPEVINKILIYQLHEKTNLCFDFGLKLTSRLINQMLIPAHAVR